MSNPPIVITGPTASGKTSLAIKLAKEFNGEIICADSRTIYKCMDIGTAKPTIQEMSGIAHWGLDLVEPDIQYSVADFKKYANDKIKDIRNRGKTPFLVGGSGLYIDSVVFDYKFPVVDLTLKHELEKKSVEELQEYCKQNNIGLPENFENKLHLVNAICRRGKKPEGLIEPVSPCFIVGITTDKNVLKQRISTRINKMIEDGVVEETTSLVGKYGRNIRPMAGNIYKIMKDYIDGFITIDRAKELAIIADWKLAKKQITWMRRNPYIQWCDLEMAYKYLCNILARDVNI